MSTLFTRRGFLTGAGAALLHAATSAQAFPRFFPRTPFLKAYPFTLGVASGDPEPDGVVLWTRLAPAPLTPDGGMPARPVFVEWQVATDERMRRVVRRGLTLALPELGHSVHVEVRGLLPSRWYWYRFAAGSMRSAIGRTRTAPPRAVEPRQLRFAFASCQHYPSGFYSAYQRLAEEDLDFVAHLGDYIYEGAGERGVRQHLPATELMSLADYRIRHAQYKSDPSLQAAHAAFPWVVTWDDHDTADDYGGSLVPGGTDPAAFLDRRAHAYQAYYEHMPLRARQIPRGPDLQLYRRLAFGRLADLHVLDTRQYRSALEAPNCQDAERLDGYCPATLDATRTIEGEMQRAWLIDGLDRSVASWNILANQVLFSPFDFDPDPVRRRFGGEKWDGYPFDRSRLLDFIAARRLSNTVVITGDLHANVTLNVPPDYVNLDAEPIATEFIGTSISSDGDNTFTSFGPTASNPHLRLFDTHRGYTRCTLSRERWQTDYRAVASVLTQDSPISTVASFVVERGRAGAERA